MPKDDTILRYRYRRARASRRPPWTLTRASSPSERHRIKTPQPSHPEAVAKVVAKLVRHFDYEGPVGCTFPAVVRRGVTLSAANVDESWIGTDAAALFDGGDGSTFRGAQRRRRRRGRRDEIWRGPGGGGRGVFVLTFGTGIGSALFHRRKTRAQHRTGAPRTRRAGGRALGRGPGAQGRGT